MTTRRDLLGFLGAAAMAAPFAALAQQTAKVVRVGVLGQGSGSGVAIERRKALVQGLSGLGYVEGKNLVLDWRYSDGSAENGQQVATELLQSQPDVLVTTSTTMTAALQKLTTRVPIVMTAVGDPIGSGFIKSFARPGGNITGLTNSVVEISPKHLELLLAIVSRLTRVAVLSNPENVSNTDTVKFLQEAARKGGVKVLAFESRNAQDLPLAFDAIARERAQGLIMAQDSLFVRQRNTIAQLAMKLRLPSIAPAADFAEAGLLISYGPNFNDIYRRSATHISKILKGAKPAELPVERPVKFDLLVNRRTAAALGVTVPHSILLSADKVIE